MSLEDAGVRIRITCPDASSAFALTKAIGSAPNLTMEASEETQGGLEQSLVVLTSSGSVAALARVAIVWLRSRRATIFVSREDGSEPSVELSASMSEEAVLSALERLLASNPPARGSDDTKR